MHEWIRIDDQPTLAELLADPIVRLLMASDCVSDGEVAALVAGLRAGGTSPATPLTHNPHRNGPAGRAHPPGSWTAAACR
jgi:hypothetical protein